MANIVQDQTKAITTDDVLRRIYAMSKKLEKKVSNVQQELVKKDNITKDFVDNIKKYTKSQTDGFITVWFFNGIPTLENVPFIDFSDEEKENRIEDLYYDKETGKVYQLQKNDEIFEWIEIIDNSLAQSLAIANSEPDTADTKRNIYFQLPNPPYDVGDLWIDNTLNKRCRCTRSEGDFHSTDWINQEDFNENSVLSETRALLDQFFTTVEKDYVTYVTFEATRDSIQSSVESVTTKVETLETNVDSYRENTENDLASLSQRTNEVSELATKNSNDYLDVLDKLNDKADITNITEVTKRVEELTTATERTTTIVEDIQTNGVGQVHTETGYTFDKDGLHITQTDAKTDSTIDESGVNIRDHETQKIQAFNGYVNEDLVKENSLFEKYLNTTISYARNFLVEEYLAFINWRFEETTHPIFGKGLGFIKYGGDD